MTMREGCTPYPAEFAERYRREGYWRTETIADAIVAAARDKPDAPAITDDSRTISFAQLIDETAAVAAVLDRAGMRRGDRIVIQLPNSIEFATLTLACFDRGIIPVMALPAYRRAELEHLIAASDARALAIAPTHRGFDHAALARELKSELPSLETILTAGRAEGCISLSDREASVSRFPTHGGDPFDVALFLLSGGTTGLPKLIPRTHTDYLYNARASAAVCGLASDSRILLALPAQHNFPLACPGLLGALLTGASAILTNSTRPDELVALAARHRITHLPCVPTYALGILALTDSERSNLSSLRVITVGGQRLQEPTARALKGAMPAVIVQQVLGMAEGLLCYTRLDDPEEVTFVTQGRPLSAADEIRIVDADGADVAHGELGELWCRGPYTIRGYYSAPERNRESFTEDGFYRTGDLVRLAPSGNLVVEGRIKDLINRGGEKISAEEVEAHLIEHPAVESVAVVAMPDAMLGEKACAFVVLRADARLSLADVREFLGSRGVARFKWPERIEIVSAMPLTNVGKIKKSDLRRAIASRIAAEKRDSQPASTQSGS